MTSAPPPSAAPSPAPDAGSPTAFRIERTHLLALLLITGIAILGAGAAPKLLGWLVLFPLLGIWWALRAQTTVDNAGLRVRYGFRPGRTITWEEFEGIGFSGATAWAKAGDKRHNLPGITFNSLPQLAAASGGRIPDALSAGRQAADEKVVIIHRDGHRILLDKEEYERYQREHPDA